LAERIRAAGVGIPVFFTPTGYVECTPQGLRLIDKVDGLVHAELERLLGLVVQP
jgi:3-oxoadipate CoA-transferase beta subunit